MMVFRKKLCSLALALGCVGCSASDSVQNDLHHDSGAGDTVCLDPAFVTLLQFTRATPVPERLDDVLAESTAIFRGSFAGVEDGRIIDYKSGAPNPILTAVFRLRTSAVHKGRSVDSFYAEYPRAIVAPIDAFEEHLMPADCLFMLRPPGWDPRVYRFDFDGRGVPDGETLHEFNFPFGIGCAAADGTVEYPLLTETPHESFKSTKIDELELEITRRLAATSKLTPTK